VHILGNCNKQQKQSKQAIQGGLQEPAADGRSTNMKLAQTAYSGVEGLQYWAQHNYVHNVMSLDKLNNMSK